MRVSIYFSNYYPTSKLIVIFFSERVRLNALRQLLDVVVQRCTMSTCNCSYT